MDARWRLLNVEEAGVVLVYHIVRHFLSRAWQDSAGINNLGAQLDSLRLFQLFEFHCKHPAGLS